MLSKDFRVGNFVEYKIQDQLDNPQEYWAITKIDAIDISIFDGSTNDNYRRIPITADQLLRLGFYRFNNPNNTPSYIWARKNKAWFLEDWRTGKIRIIPDLVMYDRQIEYVDELQNLYFFKTGMELEYKLKSPGKQISKALRDKVYEKYDGRCAYSGKYLDDDWQIDHMYPKSKEISPLLRIKSHNDFENLMPVCGIINAFKKDKDIADFKRNVLELHKELKKLPSKPQSKKKELHAKSIMQICELFDITTEKPFSGKFFFEIYPNE